MKYYNITVNGVAYSVSVEETAAGAAPVAAAAPAAPAAPKAAPAPAAAPKAAAGAAGAVSVKAPMPGGFLRAKNGFFPSAGLHFLVRHLRFFVCLGTRDGGKKDE